MASNEITFDNRHPQSIVDWLKFFQNLDFVFTLYRNDLFEILQFTAKNFTNDSFFEMSEEKMIYDNEIELELKNDYVEKLKKFLMEIKIKFSNVIYPDFLLHLRKRSLAIFPNLSSERQILGFYLHNVIKKERFAMNYFDTYSIFRSINYFGHFPYGFFIGMKINTFKSY